MAEKISRRMRRFYRNPEQGEEAQFEREPQYSQQRTGSEELMEENIFTQLREEENKKPVGTIPQGNILKKPGAIKIAVNKVEEFKSKYRRFPRKDEYDQIAESIFEQLKEQEMKQSREQREKRIGAGSVAAGAQDLKLSRAERLSQRHERNSGTVQKAQGQAMPKQTVEQTERPELKELQKLEIKDVLGENKEETEEGKESIESLEKGIEKNEEGTEEEFSLAGLETDSEEKKCPNCKKKTEEIIFCPDCGNAFCEQCAKIERIGSEKKIFCPKCKKQVKK